MVDFWGLIAFQNVLSHQIITRVISLYPKLSAGTRNSTLKGEALILVVFFHFHCYIDFFPEVDFI